MYRKNLSFYISFSHIFSKKKVSEAKAPRTGGGPKPPAVTPAEEAVLDSLEGRPTLEDVDGAVDSILPQAVNLPLQLSTIYIIWLYNISQTYST